MIRLLTLFLTLGVMGCDPQPDQSSSGNEFPSEFQGEWVFDEDAARSAIMEMPIDDEAKLELEDSFIGIVRGERRYVDSSGRITGDSYPDQVVISLHVVEQRPDGFITRTSNSMNPDIEQFNLNTISDEVWRSQLLDESFKPVESIPDDFWKRPEQGSEGNR